MGRTKYRARWLLLAVIGLMSECVTDRCQAADLEQLAQKVGVRVLAAATSDKDVLAYTRSRLPYSRMSQGARQRANEILNDLSQYRRMPSLQYPVNPAIYQYLISNPDVAVATWRAMGISKLKMWQTSQFEYDAAAIDGSNGSADVLWRDGNQCLFIVEGRYNSPLLPNSIEASALVWLQYRFVTDGDGQPMVNQQVETFIRFPSAAIETIARLATRVTNTILDRNVFEVSLYARMMSQAAAKDPSWVAQVAKRMDGVPEHRQTELTNLAYGRSDIAASGATHRSPSTSTPGVARLTSSGEFRSFESSMHLLNKHVPLAPSQIRHQPSYGQHIGSRSKAMAEPHRYVTPESKRAIAEQAAQRERILRNNSMYAAGKKVTHKPAPAKTEAPLHTRRTAKVGPLMDSPTSMVFFSASGDSNGAAKASSPAPAEKLIPAQPVSLPAAKNSSSKTTKTPLLPPPVPPE